MPTIADDVMIAIPQFANDSLWSIFFCSFLSIKEHPEHRQWFEDRKKTLYAETTQAAGQNVYLRRMSGIDSDGDGHFHIEAASGDYFDGFRPPFNSQPDELISDLGEMQDKPLPGRICGNYHLPLNSPIAKRIVKALLGATVDVSGYSLTLTGCTFDVSGDGPLFRVRWNVLDEEEMLALELYAAAEVAINDQVLKEAKSVLDTALKALENPIDIIKKA